MLYTVYYRVDGTASTWEMYQAFNESGLADCVATLKKRENYKEIAVYPQFDVDDYVLDQDTMSFGYVTGVGVSVVCVRFEGTDEVCVCSKHDVIPVKSRASSFGWCFLGPVNE